LGIIWELICTKYQNCSFFVGFFIEPFLRVEQCGIKIVKTFFMALRLILRHLLGVRLEAYAIAEHGEINRMLDLFDAFDVVDVGLGVETGS
jgi:hypothetical protein